MLRRAFRAASAVLAWGILPGTVLAARLAPASVAPASAPAAIAIASGSSLLEPGSSVVVSWPDGPKGGEYDEMELVLSLDGGRTFPLRVTRRIAPSDAGYSWTVPSLPAAHARLALRAGVNEEEDSETILCVSGEFAIAPSAHLEEVFRVGEEERTRDALEGAPVPARPDSGVGPVAERLTIPVSLDLPGRPDSSSGEPPRGRPLCGDGIPADSPAGEAPAPLRFTARRPLRL